MKNFQTQLKNKIYQLRELEKGLQLGEGTPRGRKIKREIAASLRKEINELREASGLNKKTNPRT